MARGIHARRIADELLARANEELARADLVAERIVQLGGEPDFLPGSLLVRSHAEDVAGRSLMEVITGHLVASRIAIDSTGS
jgi:bacterioferritin